MTDTNRTLLDIINLVRANKGRGALAEVLPAHRLREDCQLDSLDLAELTVRLEEAFGVDVFADGIVRTVGEIQAKLPR